MDQKFGPPTSEEQRQIMEWIETQILAETMDPKFDELRAYVQMLQINAAPPAVLLQNENGRRSG